MFLYECIVELLTFRVLHDGDRNPAPSHPSDHARLLRRPRKRNPLRGRRQADNSNKWTKSGSLFVLSLFIQKVTARAALNLTSSSSSSNSVILYGRWTDADRTTEFSCPGDTVFNGRFAGYTDRDQCFFSPLVPILARLTILSSILFTTYQI